MFRSFSLPGYSEIDLSFPIKAIGQKLAEIKPAYIHIATEGPMGIAARRWIIKNNYQFTTSYHTNLPEYSKLLYKIPESWIWKYVKWFHSGSKNVLVPTQTVINTLDGHGFKNLKLWSRGIDASLFPQPSASPINKINPNLKALLYVGRVSKEKNLDILCELADNKNYECWIVGDGPYKSTLEKKYTSTQVRFFGAIEHKSLAPFYQSADVFVFPSKTDTFGIVMIESMACGTPVAAYPVQGPIDVVANGISGALNNNIEQAIQSALKLPKDPIMSYAKQFTWERCASTFIETIVPTRN
jgi:glycosyltransferase involved in cell wall biosynthesis